MPSEIEAPSRHLAGIISRQAGPANVRPHGVDTARGRDADFANKRRAAIAVASDSSLPVIDEYPRDPIKRGVVLQ
jgi:hypothetical protein